MSNPRLLALVLILATAALRFVYLAFDCPLDLSPDEAHYWDWSRHLDWSYYSKGPLVAWVIRASCAIFGPTSVAWTGSEMLAVRLPAVVCGSLLAASIYVLTARILRDEWLALLTVALALSFPVIAAGSLLMTIDSPYTCLWGWALVVGHQAIFRGSAWAWPALGLLLGVGILAKYTMVLLVPCLGLFLLFTPTYRRLLGRPGFWIMCGIGAACCLPIVIWNAEHGWVTLKHTQGHAGVGLGIQWLGPFRYVGMQAAMLLGFWFVVWAMALVRYRPWGAAMPAGLPPRLQPLSRHDEVSGDDSILPGGPREGDVDEFCYLWWMSAPIFVFFGLFSVKNGGGQPNWPVAAYLAGMVLMASYLAECWAHANTAQRRWIAGACGSMAALGLLLTLLVHDTRPFRPVLLSITGPASAERPMPVRLVDPTCRLRGHRALARRVDALRGQLQAEGRDVVLAGTRWTVPGELGFYCDGQPPVYSLGLAVGDRHSQYDLWHPNPVADPEVFAGRTFVVVGFETPILREAFARRLSTEIFRYEEDGMLIDVTPIHVYEGFRGLAARISGY